MFYRIILFLALIILLVSNALSQTKETFRYDDLGRISGVTYTQGNQVLIINYEYDKRGNITRTRSELTTSVDEKNPAVVVTVSPNPTSQDVVIEAPAADGEVVNFTITTNSGRQIFQTDATADATGKVRLTFDTASRGIASGTYQAVVSTKAGVNTATFVVAK